jgi:hypothetical protein
VLARVRSWQRNIDEAAVRLVRACPGTFGDGYRAFNSELLTRPATVDPMVNSSVV